MPCNTEKIIIINEFKKIKFKRDGVENMFLKQPFDEFLGLQYERMNEAEVKLTLPVQPLFINTLGVVHGGIISSLADIAMGNIFEVAANSTQTIMTVDLKVTYLKAAKGEYILAHAKLVKKGNMLSHVDCFIYDDNQNLVAKAYGIFANSKNEDN